MRRSTNSPDGRAASEWFGEAARWYLQGHQGCPSCHARHCVFRHAFGPRVEYHCTACDFSVCHDGASGQYFAASGEPAELPGHGLLAAPEGELVPDCRRAG